MDHNFSRYSYNFPSTFLFIPYILVLKIITHSYYIHWPGFLSILEWIYIATIFKDVFQCFRNMLYIHIRFQAAFIFIESLSLISINFNETLTHLALYHLIHQISSSALLIRSKLIPLYSINSYETLTHLALTNKIQV